MGRITVEGERMRSLVEELLLLARLDQGLQSDRSAVDVEELLGEAVGRARAVDPRRPIELHVESGTETGARERLGGADEDAGSERRYVVSGSRADLGRMLDNLLTNALVHTEPGTPVRASLQRDPEHVVIEVSDDGPGMTAEESAHAFDRFYRSEPSRSRPGGSGLGLAIVRAIVGSHDGTVELDTAPGEGATFTVTLPTSFCRP